MFLLNIRRTGSSTPCGTPTKPTVDPGRAHANACFIESSVPTHSRTASAPTPSVSSLMRSAPSLPRSATMWVAPNWRAISWRCSWRDIAITRSAPLSAAARTPHKPTAPAPPRGRGQARAQADGAVPDDHHGVSRLHPSGHGTVPAGREDVGEGEQGGQHGGVGHAVGLHQTAFGLVHPGVLGLTADGEPEVDAGVLGPGPAVGAGVVTVAERGDHEVTGCEPGHLAAHLLDHADHLVTDRVAGSDVVLAAVGPQVRAADAPGRHLDDGVGGSLDGRLGALLEADVTGCVDGGGA